MDTHKQVTRLMPGDILDLENDPYADPHGAEELLENDFVEVTHVEYAPEKGSDAVIVTVDCMWETMTVMFPANHEVLMGVEL